MPAIEHHEPIAFETVVTQKFGKILRHESEQLFCRCPKCQHDSLTINIAGGYFFCFFCDYGRGEPPLPTASGVQRAEVDLEDHTAVARFIVETAELDPSHHRYLLKRGIVPKLHRLFSIDSSLVWAVRQAFPRDVLLRSGFFYLGSDDSIRPRSVLAHRRIGIPFWQGSEFETIKARTDPFDETEPKYTSPMGSALGSRLFYRRLFGPDLIVTESELKTLALVDHGYCAVGIAGLGVLSPKCVELLKSAAQSFRRVFVVFDRTEGRVALELARTTIVLQAIDNAVSVDLPMLGSKGEIDEYLLHVGPRNFDHLIEKAWRDGKQKSPY